MLFVLAWNKFRSQCARHFMRFLGSWWPFEVGWENRLGESEWVRENMNNFPRQHRHHRHGRQVNDRFLRLISFAEVALISRARTRGTVAIATLGNLNWELTQKNENEKIFAHFPLSHDNSRRFIAEHSTFNFVRRERRRVNKQQTWKSLKTFLSFFGENFPFHAAQMMGKETKGRLKWVSSAKTFHTSTQKRSPLDNVEIWLSRNHSQRKRESEWIVDCGRRRTLSTRGSWFCQVEIECYARARRYECWVEGKFNLPDKAFRRQRVCLNPPTSWYQDAVSSWKILISILRDSMLLLLCRLDV